MVTRAAAEENASEESAERGDKTSESDILNEIHLLFNELYRLSYDRIWLAALETRKAGESLVIMVIAAVLVAVTLVMAWIGLSAVAVLVMVANGVLVTSAILLAVVINLFLALILCGVIRRSCRYLQFPATLRSFQPKDSGQFPLVEKKS
jgi:hypothetical protein